MPPMDLHLENRLIDGGEAVGLYAPITLYSREIPNTHFCQRLSQLWRQHGGWKEWVN
jgi:hypothetical protein